MKQEAKNDIIFFGIAKKNEAANYYKQLIFEYLIKMWYKFLAYFTNWVWVIYFDVFLISAAFF